MSKTFKVTLPNVSTVTENLLKDMLISNLNCGEDPVAPTVEELPEIPNVMTDVWVCDVDEIIVEEGKMFYFSDNGAPQYKIHSCNNNKVLYTRGDVINISKHPEFKGCCKKETTIDWDQVKQGMVVEFCTKDSYPRQFFGVVGDSKIKPIGGWGASKDEITYLCIIEMPEKQ